LKQHGVAACVSREMGVLCFKLFWRQPGLTDIVAVDGVGWWLLTGVGTCW